MADKFNLDGFAVDENDVCTADGGFVGGLSGGVSTKYGTNTAISLLDSNVIISGSSDLTLADGSDGQRMAIVTLSSGGSVTADFGGTTTTITFSTAGEGVSLVWFSSGASSGWYIVGNNGAVLS